MLGALWLGGLAALGCNQYPSSAPPSPSARGQAGDTSTPLPRDFGNAGSGQGVGAAMRAFANEPTQPTDTLDITPPPADSPRSSVRGSLAAGFLAPADDGWLVLIEGEWELDAGSEAHLCVRSTATRDVYLHEFSPESPPGSHHSVLTVPGGSDGADGASPCGGANVSGRQLYGSGVGTAAGALPDGIAMQVHAGEQLLLDLHLFNAGSETLKGRSGVLTKTMPEQQVQHVAAWILAGPISLSIPPGRVVQTGKCTFSDSATLFSVGPHMHQLGVHMKVTAQRAQGGSSVLFDGPYSFDSQLKYPVDFVQMNVGDTVQLECTYDNTTDHRVSWGQSTLDEMCFAGLLRFPPSSSGSYLCMN
jgi:hypothetical protein